MSEKKQDVTDVDEDILRYIFNSKFHPDMDENPFIFKSPVTDVIEKARDYESARNLILDAASTNPDILKELRFIANQYSLSHKKADELWEPSKTFVGDLKSKRKSKNAEGMAIEDVLGKADLIASAFGYQDGRSDLYKGLEESGYNGISKEALEKEIAKRISTESGEGENWLERMALQYRLGFSNNADNDYMAEKMAEYLSRAKAFDDSKKHEDEHPVLHSVGGFIAPNIQKKKDVGLTPNIADELSDIGMWGIGGAGTKAALGERAALNGAEMLVKKSAPVLKPALYAGASSGGIGFIHDLTDSALTKHVYSDKEDGKEIVDRGDVGKVIDNWPSYAKQSAFNALFAPVIAQASIANSVYGKTRGFVKNAIDKLLGTNKTRKALEKIESREAAAENIVNEKMSVDNLKKEQQMYVNQEKELIKEAQQAEKDRDAIKALMDSKKQDGKKISADDKRKYSKAQEARKETLERLDRLDLNKRMNAADQKLLEYERERALNEIASRYGVLKEQLEKSISKRDAIPSALFYLGAIKNQANNTDDYKLNFSTIGRLMPN